MLNKGDKVRFRHAYGEIVGEIVKITKKGIDLKDLNDGTILTVPSMLAHLLKPEPVSPISQEEKNEKNIL